MEASFFGLIFDYVDVNITYAQEGKTNNVKTNFEQQNSRKNLGGVVLRCGSSVNR